MKQRIFFFIKSLAIASKMAARKFSSYLAVVLVLGVAVDRTFADEPQKIVNGDKAFTAELPYQVSFQTYGASFCGGSIVSDRHVLTAAHCFNGIEYFDSITVVTGSVNVLKGEHHAIEKVQIHEDYQHGVKNLWKNDIALVTLKTNIRINAFQRPIALPSKDTPANVEAIASGFGRLHVKGPRATFLQRIKTNVIPNEKCKELLAGLTDILYPTQICTLAKPGAGICQGDSGGPLAYNNKLIGIVSFAQPCATGRPDVFTRVYAYVNWIKKAMA